MPYTMEFDQKHVPGDLLYKLEEAKREEVDSMYADANAGPSFPASGQSPVGEVAAEIFAHLADDGDFQHNMPEDARSDLKDKKNSKNDLDDRAKPKDGMRGDFMADSEGPVAAADVGKPEKVTPAWDRDIGGGGGGGSGGAGGDGGAGPGGGDDYFEVDAWRRKRRSGEIDEGEGEVEEETPVEEGPESEHNKG
jgi:hypothetical protein